MGKWYERTEMLIGEEAVSRLRESHVAVFGIGGVGSFAAEVLARAGVGRLTLVDGDVVSDSNRNRQIIATVKTVGQAKVDVMRDRILDINPEAVIDTYPYFVLPGELMEQFPFSEYSYLIDAVDTVAAKLELAVQAVRYHIPIISCMGTGNKLDPGRLEVTDLFRTKVCPLARVMRRELRKRGIEELEVVYSSEEPLSVYYQPDPSNAENTGRRSVPGSVSFVPSAAGILLAATVVRKLVL